jgi:hypothetical protein
MRASLDKSLLRVMLIRGGWLSSAQVEPQNQQNATDDPSRPFLQSEEWVLSRHFSRQCALASEWTGNGLDDRSAIVESCDLDFTELANGCFASDTNPNGNLVFSASICGRFLMVAKDTLIYVYDMRSGSLAPITSVVCPRRVLSMSMDTSAGRHAVAALLEGRMGMVCELLYGRERSNEKSADVYVESPGRSARSATRTTVLTSHAGDPDDGTDFVKHASSTSRGRSPTPQDRDAEPFSAVNLRSNTQSVALRNVDNHGRHERNLINQTWNLNLRAPLRSRTSPVPRKSTSRPRCIPVESGTSTFYRHLCSEDDPPRSVSICPQRRCVAFGCSAGIELHWIDALTGQSLSR